MKNICRCDRFETNKFPNRISQKIGIFDLYNIYFSPFWDVELKQFMLCRIWAKWGSEPKLIRELSLIAFNSTLAYQPINYYYIIYRVSHLPMHT